MKADISIDFLTFTVRNATSPEYVITDILEMDFNLFEFTKGRNLYEHAMTFNNITVCFDGYHGDIMGICVTMSGQGCRAYEEYHGSDILRLLKVIDDSKEMHGTRIDIACDDKVGILNMDYIWECAHNGMYRTKVKSKNFQESYKGKCTGARSVYFGSKSSMFRVRIYDKAKETYSLEHQTELYYSHWIRFESVYKDIYADQVIKALVESDNLGETVAGLINNRFSFINNDDCNISRCSLCDWWADFLESMKNIVLSNKAKVEHSIDYQWEYFKYSYGRFVERIISAKGEDAFIDDILKYGKTKITEADKAQIQDFKEKQEVDLWQPIFGRVSRKPINKKRLGAYNKPYTYNGDLRVPDSELEYTEPCFDILSTVSKYVIDDNNQLIFND